jgi:hypothetical protein
MDSVSLFKGRDREGQKKDHGSTRRHSRPNREMGQLTPAFFCLLFYSDSDEMTRRREQLILIVAYHVWYNEAMNV